MYISVYMCTYLIIYIPTPIIESPTSAAVPHEDRSWGGVTDTGPCRTYAHTGSRLRVALYGTYGRVEIIHT